MTLVPTLTPETKPVLFTVATPCVALDQTPPAVALVNWLVVPEQKVVVPVIAATTGIAFTAITDVLAEVQPPEVTE